MSIIAIDLGGTQIKGALFQNDVILKQSTLQTEESFGKDHIMNQLFKLIDLLWNQEVESIGIVSAGSIDVSTGSIISNTGTLSGWIDFSIKDAVMDHFHVPCVVENDANGAMVGEMQYYLKQGIENAVMITLGTGVGTAVFIRKELYRGSFYNVEFGHSTLIPEGKQCTCGLKGCAESYLSGNALTKLAKEEVSEHINHGEELMAFYAKKDEKAIKVIEQYLSYLALFIQNITKYYDPEIIIIGGGVSKSLVVLEDRLKKHLNDLNIKTPIKLARLKNDAGIYGAYILAQRGHL